MRIWIASTCFLGVLLSTPAYSQTKTTCQWIGNVWTCEQPTQSQGIDWGILNNSRNQQADSFRRGVEMGEQARRAEREGKRGEQRGPEAGVSQALSPEIFSKWLERAKPRMGLYPDFAKVVFESDVAITPDMVLLMATSDYAADIAYYLGTHKAESLAIARLPLLEAAKALDDIERKVKLSAPDKPPLKLEGN